MLKRQFSEVKNVLMILLAVFFVATLTIATASAATSSATTSTEGLQKSSTNSQEIQGSVVEVTQLEQINAALQKGPVLLEFGADWCTYCHEMKPILQELATEYKGKATIMSADVDKSPKLVDYFGVEDGVPDSTVIVGIENNKYVYMQEDGRVSKDRSNARIMGFTDKQEFENVLDLALGDTSVQDLALEDTNIQNLEMNDTNVQNLEMNDTSVQDLDLDDTSVPVADFTSNITEGYSPLTVQFIDKSTGSPTSWSWDFGDGTTSTVQNPTHTYSKAGNYTVTLTAENIAGSTTVTDSSFIVLAAAKTPTDACSTSPITGKESLSVKLNDTGTSNSTSCTWKCDDGNTLTAQNPSDKCTKKGTYTVSLTVKKHDCCCKRK